MERGLLPLPPTVIEGVLDVTTVYYITLETRTGNCAPPLCSFCQASVAKQEAPQPKCRPVATVRPFPAAKEDEGYRHPLTPGPEVAETRKEELTFTDQQENNEKIRCECIEEDSSCILSAGDSCNTLVFDSCHESKEEERVASSLLLDTPLPSPLPSPPSVHSSLPPTEAQLAGRETRPGQETRDPCCCHRDSVRTASGKRSISATFSAKRMDVCQNGEECHDGPGCAGDLDNSLKGESYKETCLTECLDEFLEELQLTHLANYLRVLGCTCVRDLRLLEEPELNAIQLISRRRLLKRLESLSFHHEAPPQDCSLEGWLTWYGLTHISGFLSAIGVHTVGDLTYLKEEDLELLKPVTRRRILTCYRK